MGLEIISESVFCFSIKLNGVEHWLEQRGGDWRMDGLWVASRRIDWPEAIARALRVATDSVSNRTKVAIANRSALKSGDRRPNRCVIETWR